MFKKNNQIHGPVLLAGDSPYFKIIASELGKTDLLQNRPIITTRPKREELVQAHAEKASLIIIEGVDVARELLDDPSMKDSQADILATSINDASCAFAGSAKSGKIRTICPQVFFPRLAAQVSRQKDLLAVYQEIFSYTGNEFYFYEAHDLAGYTYGRSLRAFETACPVGLRTAGGTTLNPPMNTILEKEDTLVLLAPSHSLIKRNEAILPAPDRETLGDSMLLREEGESFLFLGWNTRCLSILDEMDHYARKGSRVLIIAPELSPLRNILTNREPFRRLTIETREGPVSDRSFLDETPWEFFENILIPGSAEEGDESALLLLDQVRSLLEARGFTNNLTALTWSPVEPMGKDILSYTAIWKIAAQIAMHPEYDGIIEELTTPHGAEVYLKPAENYIKLDTPINFYTIIEAAKQKSETAIGYIVNDTITLNPPKADKHSFFHFDRIIVLADDH